jgi:hypothetical protein
MNVLALIILAISPHAMTPISLATAIKGIALRRQGLYTYARDD